MAGRFAISYIHFTNRVRMPRSDSTEPTTDTVVGFTNGSRNACFHCEYHFDSIANQISGLVWIRELIGADMQTNRTDFEAGFALLGLDSKPGANYSGAMNYARQFKKCSILTEVNVSYSASTSASCMKQINKK